MAKYYVELQTKWWSSEVWADSEEQAYELALAEWWEEMKYDYKKCMESFVEEVEDNDEE